MTRSQTLRLEIEDVRRLVEDLSPGSIVVGFRSLAGGARRRVFEVRWRNSDGTPSRVVVRLVPERGGMRENAMAEFKTLTALDALMMAVPRPLLLDLEGKYFNHSAIVMDYAGRPIAEPDHPDSWLKECSLTLARLHGLSVDARGFLHLPRSNLDDRRAELEAALTPEHVRTLDLDNLIGRVPEAVEREAQNQRPTTSTLVHNDYWPGNILWRKSKISAVIDWTEASVGDPARDVAQFQIDLALMYGVEQAAGFGRLYSEAAGREPKNLRYVQLYGIRPAFAHLEDWYLPGYVDLGMRLTLEDLQKRFREYIRWLLA